MLDHRMQTRAFPRRQQHGRIGWFIAVGCAAAAVHWVVVVALVGRAGWQPLVANVAGWLVAFTVSFAGHHRLTFGAQGAPVWPSARRFFAVSAFGFAVNECAYAALLRWSGQHYGLALAVVLLGVAVVTYLLSRHWVFLRREPR
jgi:putative flippase GtrA